MNNTIKYIKRIAKALRIKKIIDEYYNVFGYQVQIRMLPHEFLKDLKDIHRLADDRKFSLAKEAVERAYNRWGYGDPDLIRADTFCEFMTEDDNNENNGI